MYLYRLVFYYYFMRVEYAIEIQNIAESNLFEP